LTTRTPLVRLGDRKYFKHALADRLWKVGENRWYVENVRSKTTTAVRTLLSKKSSINCVNSPDESGKAVENSDDKCTKSGYELFRCEVSKPDHAVVAIQAKLISVTDPVLSPGVSFAVIDDQGRVVFHSDQRRVLKDNLFQEVSNGSRLRAAVISDTGRHMKLNYLGRPHQVYVSPMGDLPWSVAVFSDTEPGRTVIFEILGHSMVLALAFLLINLVLTLLYLAWSGQELPRWFWVTLRTGRYHAKWSLLLSLILLLFIILLSGASADSRLIVCLFIPVTIVTLILFSSRHRGYAMDAGCAKPISGGRFSARLWYVVASGLLWFSVAVLPASVFYSNALTSAMKEFVKQENVIHGEDLEARQCSMADYYSRIPRECGDRNTCECRRGKACRDDIYRSLLFDPKLNMPTPGETSVLPSSSPFRYEAPSRVWKWLANFKPIYSDSLAYRRYLHNEDGSSWEAGVTGELAYKYPHPLCGDSEEITSVVPVSGSNYFHPAVLFPALVLLFLGYAWLKYVANKIYFYDIEECGQPGLNDVMENNSQVLAFMASEADRKCLLSVKKSDICIKEINGPIGGIEFKELEELSKSHKRLLVLAEFDAQSFGCRVPRQMAVKWFIRSGKSVVTPKSHIGGAFWRRHLDKMVDSDWLNRELSVSSDLFSAERSELIRQALKDGMTKRQALLLLSECLDDYYRTLWKACSTKEQHVLVQLIEEAVVNPKQGLVVRKLLRWGIIRRDPALRTMNDSFAQWIACNHAPELVRTWEKSATGTRWSQLRWVFAGMMVLVFAFLWFTQRHVVESGLAFLSIAGIAIPSLLKLASSVKVLGGQSGG
jgi:hypothetical protein